jgi:hypothetical protein
MQGDNKRKNIMTSNTPECPICLGPTQETWDTEADAYCPTCDSLVYLSAYFGGDDDDVTMSKKVGQEELERSIREYEEAIAKFNSKPNPTEDEKAENESDKADLAWLKRELTSLLAM